MNKYVWRTSLVWMLLIAGVAGVLQTIACRRLPVDRLKPVPPRAVR